MGSTNSQIHPTSHPSMAWRHWKAWTSLHRSHTPPNPPGRLDVHTFARMDCITMSWGYSMIQLYTWHTVVSKFKKVFMIRELKCHTSSQPWTTFWERNMDSTNAFASTFQGTETKLQFSIPSSSGSQGAFGSMFCASSVLVFSSNIPWIKNAGKRLSAEILGGLGSHYQCPYSR